MPETPPLPPARTVPLGEARQMTAKGRATMHQLSILPGPGLAEVVTLIQRLEQLSRAASRPTGWPP